MVMQSLTYNKPDNGTTFETLCLKVFRTHLNLPHLGKFARSGQKQYGVDLVSESEGRVIAIQCKLKNTETGFTVKAIDEAVDLAKTFSPPLNEFIIATTADRDPVIQQHAIRITQNHQGIGLFGVRVYAWQDIEEIFKQDSELASEVYGTPASIVQTLNVASYTEINNYQLPQGTSHAEIDEAARYITEGEPDIALALLRRLKRDRWEVLTPREKFRVLANIGNSLARKGDLQQAAIAFLEASTHQPQDDPDALSIAAHGHLLSGDAQQAHRMALEACSRNPLNERAQIIRIESAPKETSYKELRDAVPILLRSKHNIALALQERALQEGNLEEAEKVLLSADERSPNVNFSLGVVLLQRGSPAGIQEGMLLLPSDPVLVQRARDYFSIVIESSKAPTGLIAAAHFNRALAASLLKDEDGAFADFRLAQEREPENEDFSAAFISEALRRDQNGVALNAAREAIKFSQATRIRMLLSISLYDSGYEENKKQALLILQEGLCNLETDEPQVRLEYLRRTLHLLHLSGVLDDESADELLKCLSDPVEIGVLRSWILFRRGRQVEAEEEARRTASLLDERVDFVHKREVATLASRLGLAGVALPIWLEISAPRGFNEDTANLLQSAQALGRDDVILEYCRSLRSNGVYAPEVAEMEIAFLVEYNELRLAQKLIKEYLEAHPRDLRLRLSLLHVAVINGWSEIVEAYLGSYPSAKDIKKVVDGARLVQILQFKGLTGEAVGLAYELVRRFPDEPESHRALIVSILGFGGPKGDLRLQAPSEVVPGSAVRFRRDGSDLSDWIVIEDSDNPQLSQGEYAPDHPLASVLIGKKVGDSFTLPPAFIRSQTAVVEEVKNKILHRMHQSMGLMNQRFPEEAFFESVPISVGDESASTGHELDEFIEFNKQLAEGPLRAEKLYSERKLPLSALADIVHRQVPEVLESLARSDKLVVQCVDGTGEEFQRVSGVLGSARSLVLDASALGTIGLLGKDFDLSRLAAKCIVSEGTLESLKRLGKALSDHEGMRGFLGYDGERLVMREIDPEFEKERASRAREFAEFIESHCEIVGGSPLARIEFKDRQKMVRVFRSETAESIAIAKESGCPLWADDYVTGVLAQSELLVPRVWTQAVCFWLRDAGSMSSEECNVVTARLCSFNYRFTSISVQTIVTACGLSDWDPDKQPLLGVLERLGEHEREQDMLMLAAGLLPAAWREAPLLDSASRVTIRVLEKVSTTRRGLAIIHAIHGRLDELFGVNVLGADDARRVVEAWLSAATRGRIIES